MATRERRGTGKSSTETSSFNPKKDVLLRSSTGPKPEGYEEAQGNKYIKRLIDWAYNDRESPHAYVISSYTLLISNAARVWVREV